MLQSIITPVAVLLLAVGASYATTRPNGDLRRHIAAMLMILALGFIGAVIGGFSRKPRSILHLPSR